MMPPRTHETYRDGALVERIDLTATYDLTALKTQAIADVKADAQQRIAIVFGYTLSGPGDAGDMTALIVKELNLTARSSELNNILHTRAWTADEQSEWDAGQAQWNKVKAIRALSNTMEGEINALSSNQSVFDYNDAMPTDSRWP
jgi:hypothetical protein